MQIDNWKYVYKKDYELDLIVETNLVYSPMTNPDNNIFCMVFDHTDEYQNYGVKHVFPSRPNYTAEAVKFFFQRELHYRDKFKAYPWAPNYIHDDFENQRIFFEWSGISCNKGVVERTIETECPDWEEQLCNIVNDLLDAGCYKTTLYPHCFFIENGVLKMFDYYGCAEIDDSVISLKDVEPILTPKTKERLSSVIINDAVDTKFIFKQALEGYSRWNSNKLKELARKIF